MFSNGIRLEIKQKKEEREIPGAQTIFVEVDDIDGLYNKFKATNVKFLKGLVHQNWAANFSIADPDDNKIQFMSQK